MDMALTRDARFFAIRSWVLIEREDVWHWHGVSKEGSQHEHPLSGSRLLLCSQLVAQASSVVRPYGGRARRQACLVAPTGSTVMFGFALPLTLTNHARGFDRRSLEAPLCAHRS